MDWVDNSLSNPIIVYGIEILFFE